MNQTIEGLKEGYKAVFENEGVVEGEAINVNIVSK